VAEPGSRPVPSAAGGRRPSKLARSGAVAGVLFSLFYLVNPGAGVIELLPDNLPFIGNLDEVGITGFLVYCLRVLGLEVIPKVRGAGKRP
jgi:uncharacterized membrane protein YkvA (DUF1232 family)